MTITIDWVLFLLAAICFLLGAISVGVAFGANNSKSINWMLLGFFFITVTFLTP
jgi:hypothetical protein